MLDAVTTLNVDILRTSLRNGSTSTASNRKDSTSGLPACNACGDCTLGLGKAGLTTTLIEVVEDTLEGTEVIPGLPALGVEDSMPRDLGTNTFRYQRTLASRGLLATASAMDQ